MNGQSSTTARRKPRGRFSFPLTVFGIAAAVSVILLWTYFRVWDPSTARFSMRLHPVFFPLLLVHITGASVAMATCVAQLSPWLRRRHPRIHRYVGWVYVFGGAGMASGAGLILLSVWPEPPLNEFSDIITGAIWFGATAAAYRFARQRRYADHRRWMLRSFAITASFPITLIFFIPLGWILRADAHSQFSASRLAFSEMRSGLNTWLSWIVPFLAVEWWMDRDLLRRSRAARDAAAESRRPAAGSVRPVETRVPARESAEAPVVVAESADFTAESTVPVPEPVAGSAPAV
ncbi:DUF2306 domain-containing protein [Nocardia sp. alder85J]|uniref:DUF2306 domain-containing protein n=1 Tax=Nocardia sp. alder85J TaxID=2862949 RepID=UPI001CD6D262|nr:DUF2306 domain-containing protein [Nocardia sp. alder85J]MCX4091647.1 DUF2306 domain-containing protein [Nocardia sp. alder85J]